VTTAKRMLKALAFVLMNNHDLSASKAASSATMNTCTHVWKIC